MSIQVFGQRRPLLVLVTTALVGVGVGRTLAPDAAGTPATAVSRSPVRVRAPAAGQVVALRLADLTLLRSRLTIERDLFRFAPLEIAAPPGGDGEAQVDPSGGGDDRGDERSEGEGDREPGFRLLGTFGRSGDPIAVLGDGPALLNARVGDDLPDRWALAAIAPQSVALLDLERPGRGVVELVVSGSGGGR